MRTSIFQPGMRCFTIASCLFLVSCWGATPTLGQEAPDEPSVDPAIVESAKAVIALKELQGATAVQWHKQLGAANCKSCHLGVDQVDSTADFHRSFWSAAQASQPQLQHYFDANSNEVGVSDYWIGVVTEPAVATTLVVEVKGEDTEQTALREITSIVSGGLRVNTVTEDSPAEKAGIQAGDVIIQLNDIRLAAIDQLVQLIGNNEAKAMRGVVVRGGKLLEIQLTPARRPQKPDEIEVSPSDLALAWIATVQEFKKPIVDAEVLEGFPDNVTVHLTLKKGAPVTVKLEVDGKTYDVKKEKLDSLPEKLQSMGKSIVARYWLNVRDNDVKVTDDYQAVLEQFMRGSQKARPVRLLGGVQLENGALGWSATNTFQHSLLQKYEELSEKLDRLKEHLEKD